VIRCRSFQGKTVNTRRRVSSQTKRKLERTQKSKLSLITGMKGRRHFSDTRRVSFSNLGQDAIYHDIFFMGVSQSLQIFRRSNSITPRTIHPCSFQFVVHRKFYLSTLLTGSLDRIGRRSY